jgi:hypothetical protein
MTISRIVCLLLLRFHGRKTEPRFALHIAFFEIVEERTTESHENEI